MYFGSTCDISTIKVKIEIISCIYICHVNYYLKYFDKVFVTSVHILFWLMISVRLWQNEIIIIFLFNQIFWWENSHLDFDLRLNIDFIKNILKFNLNWHKFFQIGEEEIIKQISTDSLFEK